MTLIESFITSFEQRLAPVEKASSEAWWKLATTGTEEAQEELVRAGMEYNRLFADKGEYELVKSWYEGRHSLDSAILRRQVEILYNTFAGRQGDEETLRRIEKLEAEAPAAEPPFSVVRSSRRQTSCKRSFGFCPRDREFPRLF